MPLPLALILLASQPSVASPCAAELEAARQAYGTYDVPVARTEYRRVADGSCSAEERAEASTELARILWLVDGDGAAAVARLRRVPSTGPEGCAAAAMLGRVLRQSGHAAEVSVSLEHAVSRCATLDPAVPLVVTGAATDIVAAAPQADRKRLAREALAKLASLSALAKATLEGSRQRLALALLAGDAVEASAGWRGFFAMDGGLAGSQLPADLDGLLRAGIAPGAKDPGRAALCDALVQAGFADEALRLLPMTRTGDLEWRSARAYLRMRDRLAALLTTHNRTYAAGKHPSDAGLETAILQIMRDAVAEAGRPASDPWVAMRNLWHLVGTTGRSNGVEGLHLGHVSTDAELPVSQDSRTGRVRFLALDNMVANGFSGWLGDGVTGPAGWAADGRIIQIRTRYVQTAFDRAAIASPGVRRAAYLARLARLESSDRATAQPSPAQFLPSLSARLQLSAVDALLAQLRRGQDDESTFTARFASLWYARSLDATLLQHEGRHVLDQVQFPGDAALSDAELEFRAKLSELEYGASPRVALSNIYGRLLGGTTGHGIANLRLVEVLTAWLGTHGTEVVGYQPQAPVLFQLWRIEDRQLRAIARSLDLALRN